MDIQFSQNNLPDLLTAIEIERPNEENLIVEVEQDIGCLLYTSLNMLRI